MTKILWTQRTNFGPSPRSASAIAYDSNRGRTVLFGGISSAGDFLGDTWEWDGSYWTQMQEIGPAPRTAAAMAFDSAQQVSVLFGGAAGAIIFGDTWQWDGANWTQVSESGPSGRYDHAVAFDSSSNQLVLFGGQADQAGQTLFGDTWEFDGQNWTQQQDAGPSPRFGAAMAYDGAGRVILFGGFDNNALFGDSWAWSGGEWVQIAEFGPSARLWAAMAGEGSGNIALYGGLSSSDENQPPLADTWEFDGTLWTQRQDIGPGPLQRATMAFDSARSRLVLFGGLAVALVQQPAGASGSTWEAAASPQTAPLPRKT